MAEDRSLEPVEEELAPTSEDERAGDAEYNPAMEPEKAKAWLNMLLESEKAFEEYNFACDNIEKLYANLEILRNLTRDRQFNLFWANLEILKPSIYAKAPVPVVVPKFKDRRPLYQTTSELLERCSIVAFDLTRINDLLMLVRDDLATTGRGVAWCRYEPAEPDENKSEYVCVDHKGRRDFLHSLSRNWREVTWVAAASYMTQAQARERFKTYSGDEYQKAEYKVDRDVEGPRRRRQPRARQVLGNLAQGHEHRRLGGGRLRGRARQGRPRGTGEAVQLLPVPQASLQRRAAGFAHPGARRVAVQGPA